MKNNKITSYLKYVFTIGSPILCLLLFFFSCGHPPTQEVKIFVNKPNSDYAKIAQSVNVSLRLDGYGGTLLKEKLLPGENVLLLPKGTVQISSGFLVAAQNEEGVFHFLYSTLSQEVQIDQKTQSLEIYYPELKDVFYRKFGFIFKEKTRKGFQPVSVQFVAMQEPIAEKFIQNSTTGENLGFMTDKAGRASVDLPVFGNPKSIQLFVQKLDKKNEGGELVWIPLDTNHVGIEFYEIILNSNGKVKLLETQSDPYFERGKSIQTVLNEGKNPRFQDVISSSQYTAALLNEFAQSNEFDFLQPLLDRNEEVKSNNLFETFGREIKIQCKPHDGILYLECPRIISVVKLKNLLNLKSHDKMDLLLLDQDNFSIFTDQESTQTNPMVMTLEFP